MGGVAVFDFDGTLTKKDSFKDFLVYIFGVPVFFLGVLKNFFSLAGYFLGMITNHGAKQKLFRTFFVGWSEENYRKACETYSQTKMERLIRPEAMERVVWHKSQGHQLVIVSASLVDWLRPWAINNGFHRVIATEAQIEKGVVTGKFSTPNCYGQEKRRRFLEKYPDRDEYFLYVYGDSRGDRELLELADKSFYRCFQ